MRAATPMTFSIGWALGQIIIAFICMILFNWRVIFLLTAVPLTVLLYFAYYYVKDSPRFCVTKHEYGAAKSIV
jgi:MFS family permease